MRMTKRKKEIMNLFEADNLEWVTSEIGAPPFDVAGVAYILNGMDSLWILLIRKVLLNQHVER